jgi:hypothetical protein
MASDTRPDAIRLLREDHRRAESPSRQFDGRICKSLKLHAMLDQQQVKGEEKESGNIFAQARKAEVDLGALGRQMAARKAELMELAETAGLPPARTTRMETA